MMVCTLCGYFTNCTGDKSIVIILRCFMCEKGDIYKNIFWVLMSMILCFSFIVLFFNFDVTVHKCWKLTADRLNVHVHLQEADIKELQNLIAELKDGHVEISEDDMSPELQKLATENQKLKFQILHLTKVSVTKVFVFSPEILREIWIFICFFVIVIWISSSFNKIF